MGKKQMRWVTLALAAAVGTGCAPAPGEPYEWEEDIDLERTSHALFGFLRKKPKKPRVEGEPCGNDGDTWTINEGDCVHTMRTECLYRSAVSPDGTPYLYCGCIDMAIRTDCTRQVVTPFGP